MYNGSKQMCYEYDNVLYNCFPEWSTNTIVHELLDFLLNRISMYNLYSKKNK